MFLDLCWYADLILHLRRVFRRPQPSNDDISVPLEQPTVTVKKSPSSGPSLVPKVIQRDEQTIDGISLTGGSWNLSVPAWFSIRREKHLEDAAAPSRQLWISLEEAPHPRFPWTFLGVPRSSTIIETNLTHCVYKL